MCLPQVEWLSPVWNQILALPLRSHGISDTLFNLSQLQFPIYKIRVILLFMFMWALWRLNEIIYERYQIVFGTYHVLNKCYCLPSILWGLQSRYCLFQSNTLWNKLEDKAIVTEPMTGRVTLGLQVFLMMIIIIIVVTLLLLDNDSRAYWLFDILL